MAFYDARLPDEYLYGSGFGPSLPVNVLETATGHEFRNSRQAQARHRMRIGVPLRTLAQMASLKSHFMEFRGALHSFPVKDFSDFSTRSDGQSAPTNTDQTLGTGDGVRTTFQLLKQYDEHGGDPYPRALTLPITNTVVVALNGTPTALFTVSRTNGIVTFNSPPLMGQVVTAGCQFDVPSRYIKSGDDWMQMSPAAFNVWAAQGGLDCIEVLNELEWHERWPPGGFKDHPAGSIDHTISLSDGLLQRFTPGAAVNGFLPPPDFFAEAFGGDRVLVVTVHPSALGSLQLRDDTGATVGSAMTSGVTKHLGLLITGGNATWILY